MASPAAEPFPPILRRALLWPFGAFAAAYVLAMLSRGDKVTGGIFVVLTGGAALVELLAVPTAIFLLVRDGRYVTTANIAMTVAAALPIALVILAVLVFSFGHFHI